MRRVAGHTSCPYTGDEGHIHVKTQALNQEDLLKNQTRIKPFVVKLSSQISFQSASRHNMAEGGGQSGREGRTCEGKDAVKEWGQSSAPSDIWPSPSWLHFSWLEDYQLCVRVLLHMLRHGRVQDLTLNPASDYSIPLSWRLAVRRVRVRRA